MEPDSKTLLESAARERARGATAKERELLDEAVRRAPDDPQALNALGMRALADDDAETARRCFSRAAAADPREPRLWLNFAAACRALEDVQGEQEGLEQALALDRTSFMAQLRLAELHERMGRVAQAAQGWTAVVHMAAGVQDPPPALAAVVARGEAFLRNHRDRLGQRLDAALGSDLAELGPEARRFAACVDHILGRRAIYHNECAGVHFPFLPADEFFEPHHFPWLPALEAHTDAIRAEAVALLDTRADHIRPYVKQERGTPENKWTPLDRSLDWSACFLWEYGNKNEEVCALCPETAAALEAIPQRNHIPGKAPTAFFSVLKAGAHIPPHTGVTNTRAIIHLPLVVPPGCRFRVGGETREWNEGRAFAFDDTIEHEAWNESDQRRIVLIFDVWNPHLTIAEQDLLRRFFEVSARQSTAEGRLAQVPPR